MAKFLFALVGGEAAEGGAVHVIDIAFDLAEALHRDREKVGAFGNQRHRIRLQFSALPFL